MAKPTYYELLRRPEWQKKRLEILERDEWECAHCESKDKTLHVHHAYYEWGRKPWEYESDSLLSICEDCHAAVENDKAELKRWIGRCDPGCLAEIIGYVKGIVSLQQRDEEIAIANGEELSGFADQLAVDEHDVLSVMSGRGVTARALGPVLHKKRRASQAPKSPSSGVPSGG